MLSRFHLLRCVGFTDSLEVGQRGACAFRNFPCRLAFSRRFDSFASRKLPTRAGLSLASCKHFFR